MAIKPKFYRARNPKDSPFFKLVSEHFDDFEEKYPELFEKSHGFWRPSIRWAINKFLKCGDLKEGFAKVRCPDCKHEMFVAFSCKQKTCPSCAQKRCLVLGQKLIGEVLADCGHTQWVFTIPKRLRLYFRYDRKLLGKLAKAAYETVIESIPQYNNKVKFRPGAIVAIQTFGDIINFHPHVHMLVTDDVFGSDDTYHKHNLKPYKLISLWQDKVFKLLKENGNIDKDTIISMKSWRYSGFSIDNSVKIKAGDTEGLSRLIQYMTRCPFSLARMIKLSDDGTVIYRAQKYKAIAFPKLMDPDLLAGTKRNFETFKPLEFLAEVTQHIPDKNEHQIRYYGYYSNKARGLRKKKQELSEQTPMEETLAEGGNGEELKVSAFKITWAMLIQLIYEVDPLECPLCGGGMEVKGFIEKQGEIEAILQRGCQIENLPARAPPLK